MIDVVLTTLRDLLLISGAIAVLIGAIGVLRFPDLFARIHAAGITDSAGAGLLVAGLLIEAGISLVALKLIFIFFFLFFTSPTSSHALAKAAIHGKLRPLTQSSDR